MVSVKLILFLPLTDFPPKMAILYQNDALAPIGEKRK
jgi:hypothetical protein